MDFGEFHDTEPVRFMGESEGSSKNSSSSELRCCNLKIELKKIKVIDRDERTAIQSQSPRV